MREVVNKGLGLGIYSIPRDAELIPPQSAQDSLGWISTDGEIELSRGKLLLGAEETTTSYVQGEGWGITANGTHIHFRKTNTKVQYYNTTTELWVDIITGLTDGAEMTFAPYSSLAGTFVYATSVDGIYKIHTANPGSFTSLYDSAKNFKGKSIITTSRMHMWGLENDKTGHYGSYVDSANYTTVTGEATTSLSGTLAFKAGGAERTCFGVEITLTGTGEVYSDNYNGILTGSLGGTGTINYTTGAYTLSNSGVGTAEYQWENSNNGGVTDFTYSGTRIGGQGFLVRQDEGGDAIQKIEIYDGKYYSIKSNSVYELNISDDDLQITNKIFRKNIGVPYWRASVVTGKGIFFMDTYNADNPKLTIIQYNPIGDNLEPIELAPQFDFSEYIWDECAMDTYSDYIVFSGKTLDSTRNNRLFLFNYKKNSVDILSYAAKTITQNSGSLYIGDTLTFNSYEVLSGFDDDNENIENYWIGSDNLYGSEYLKKVKRFRIKGVISPDQILEIYTSYDNSEFALIGTVRGDGTYVDYGSNFSIGSNGIGTSIIGGEDDFIDGSFYLAEIKEASTKFRKRTIKLVATGIGYVSVNMMDDYGLMRFQQRLPSKYRSKQNVSLDGTQTNQ